jgi:hypothetical protein
MSTHTPPYAGLPCVEGIKFETGALSQQVFCPYCMSPDAALLGGKIRFTAKMSEDVVADRQPLAAFICPNSHIFLLLERDVVSGTETSLRESCRSYPTRAERREI